ncbi:hypothetical protein M5E88_01100 [Akkermansia muciniphila]|nr:hypothetical protein M5E88_01100 [Akkermansia muciniphila]
MFRSSIMLLATMLCVSCVSHRPIQDSSSPPIDAANPLDGTPVALAWSSGTQLMMGVDTGAVQTSLLFSPAVESIGARLRGRGAMRTANVPVSLKDDGEPISRKQDVVMADQAPYDGLLGWECIRKYVWNINYPKRSHRFFNKLPSRIKKLEQAFPDSRVRLSANRGQARKAHHSGHGSPPRRLHLQKTLECH